MEQKEKEPDGGESPAFFGLAIAMVSLLLISLLLFGFACTVPPL